MDTIAIILAVSGWLIAALAAVAWGLVSRRLGRVEDGIDVLHQRINETKATHNTDLTAVREQISQRPTREEVDHHFERKG